jgi:hypothetical protein
MVLVLDFEKRSRLPYILLPPLSQRRKTGGIHRSISIWWPELTAPPAFDYK